MSGKHYYAMDPESLKLYIEHKNKMQEGAKLLSTEKIQEMKTAAADFGQGEVPRGYSVEDGIAYIPISGPLMPKRDFCSVLFDVEMTTYSEIINSIALAESDDSVESVVFNISSPGGSTVGLGRTAEKIKNMTKPNIAMVGDLAASAAYWLASQSNSIVAEHAAVQIGSIGVYCEVVDTTAQDKSVGIVRKAFRSANAPMKNIDPFTRDGEDELVKRITELESVFFDYIASGRQTTVENIKENYGKGGVLIARDALNNGMIDAIEAINTDEDTPIQVENNINTLAKEDSMSEKKIEMTQEEFISAVSQAATTAVEKALDAQASKNEENLAKEKAETERVAGFSSLLAGYPEQKEMINAEIKSGGFASADFAIKVSDAEKTRIAVAAENSQDEEEVAPEVKTDAAVKQASKASTVAAMCVKGRL